MPYPDGHALDGMKLGWRDIPWLLLAFVLILLSGRRHG